MAEGKVRLEILATPNSFFGESPRNIGFHIDCSMGVFPGIYLAMWFGI